MHVYASPSVGSGGVRGVKTRSDPLRTSANAGQRRQLSETDLVGCVHHKDQIMSGLVTSAAWSDRSVGWHGFSEEDRAAVVKRTKYA